MNTIKRLLSTLFTALLSVVPMNLSAQKIEFETIEINYGDIAKGTNGIKLRNGDLVFDNSTTITIGSDIFISGGNTEYKAQITLIGKDLKGNKYQVSTDVAPLYKTEKFKRELKINVSSDNNIFINEVKMTVSDNKNEIFTSSETISNSKKTSFAILINGINSNDVCNPIDLKNSYMNITNNKSSLSVVIGLNNTKEEKEIPDLALRSGALTSLALLNWSIGKETKTQEVKIALDKNNNWTYFTEIKFEKETPVLESFNLVFINACGTKSVFNSYSKKTLENNKNWEFKVKMLNENDSETKKKLNNRIIYTNASVTLSGGNIILNNNSGITFRVYDGTERKIALCCIMYRTSNGETGTTTTPWEWNSTDEIYSVSFKLDASEKNPVKITNVCIYEITSKKDTIIYDLNGKIEYTLNSKELMLYTEKSEKIKYYDPCKTKYKLKSIDYTETNVSGLYGCSFWFKFEDKSDQPSEIAMIVEVKDCNGNSEYIKVNLKLDTKTGVYSGSFNLSSIKNCQYNLVYGEIAAYNECKDKTVWSFITDQSKSNGSGTRNVATANSGKPGLL